MSLAFAVGALRGWAAEVMPDNGKREVPAEIAALLSGKAAWSYSAAAQAAYGYKDNLLLSFTDEERSAFARGGVEVLLLRLPTGRFEYTLFAQAERSHYFTSREIDHDAKVWIQTEPGYRFGETVKVSLPLTGYYYDQVFDLSVQEAEPRVAGRLKLRGAMVGPTVHWDFHPRAWAEVQGTQQWKQYDDGANDGRVADAALRFGWTALPGIELRMGGAERWRDFYRRAQFSAVGRELSGTRLKVREREGEAEVRVTLDREDHWQAKTRATLLHYDDNGSGYFSYREKKLTEEIEWRNDRWLVRVGGSVSRLDFLVQIEGIGINPPARLKEEFGAEGVVERKLSSHWTLLANYTWERSRSNDFVASYTVNEGLLGLRWSWDK